MPIFNNKQSIKPIKFGGKPDIIWMARMVFDIRIRFPYIDDLKKDFQNITLSLVRDLGIDLNLNDIVAINWGDGSPVEYVLDKNNQNRSHTYKPMSEKKTKNIEFIYNAEIYVRGDKPIYFPHKFEVNGDKSQGYIVETSNIRFCEKYKGDKIEEINSGI